MQDFIEAEQLIFIPLNEDVELWDVHIRNRSGKPRRLSVFSYAEFSYHHIEIDNINLQMSLYASGSSFEDGVIEYDFFYEPWNYHYMTANFEPDSYDCLRDRFLGNYRTETDPEAVVRGECFGSAELGGNHCGALHKRLTLQAGDQTRLLFLLGVGRRSVGQAMRTKYSDLTQVDAAFGELKDYWAKKREPDTRDGEPVDSRAGVLLGLDGVCGDARAPRLSLTRDRASDASCDAWSEEARREVEIAVEGAFAGSWRKP